MNIRVRVLADPETREVRYCLSIDGEAPIAFSDVNFSRLLGFLQGYAWGKYGKEFSADHSYLYQWLKLELQEANRNNRPFMDLNFTFHKDGEEEKQ